MAFYVLLLPWHLTSQFNAQLFKAEFGPLSQVLCTSGAPDGPSGPADPGCPICKGLAAFHFAVAPAEPPEIAAPQSVALAFAYTRDHLVGSRPANTRNRGPPLQA
jgi:hypothetical protein